MKKLISILLLALGVSVQAQINQSPVTSVPLSPRATGNTNVYTGLFFNPDGSALTGGSSGTVNPTNLIQRDKSAPGSYLIFTNRAMQLQNNPGQTNSPSLFLVVTNTTQVQAIGFLDGATINNGGAADFAGLGWFPSHTGSYMELTVDSPRSMALGWAEDDQPGSAGSPYRALQIGIGTHLQYAQLHGSLPSSGPGLDGNTNIGYSLPLIFDVESKSNSTTLFSEFTFFGRATDTNGNAKLSLYSVNTSDPPMTANLYNFNFTNPATSQVLAEFREGATPGLDIFGNLTVTNGGLDVSGDIRKYLGNGNFGTLAIADFSGSGNVYTNNWTTSGTKIANFVQLNGYDYGWGLDPSYAPGGGRAVRFGMGQLGYDEWFISSASTHGGAPNHYNLYFDTAANVMRVYGTLTATNMILTVNTNATAPANTSIVRAWVNVTNAPDGRVMKMPLYE